MKLRTNRMFAFCLILLLFVAAKSKAQGLLDVMKSMDNIDKKLTDVQAAQKRDSEKLQNHLASSGKMEVSGNPAIMDSIKSQLSEMKKSMDRYAAMDSSLTSLTSRLNSLQEEMSAKSSTGNSIPGNKTLVASNDLYAEIKDLTGKLQAVAAENAQIPAKVDPPPVPDKKGTASNLDFKPYGFIKFEAIRDNTEVAKGDWLLYANKGNSTQSKQEIFTMDARDSRFGLKLGGPKMGSDGKILGLIEVDFTGGFPNSSTAARQPVLNLRHAWLELNYPKWQARFGQDWALIAGPFPTTTSFMVLGGSGNLWMRMPQASFTYVAKPLKFAASINRAIAGNTKYDEYSGGDFDPIDDGERTGLPWVMGRTWLIEGNHTASISGHFGQELIADLSARKHRKDSYSINADLVSKFGHLSYTGRVFYGANINTFFGGIFQGFISDSTSVKNVKSIGGWSQIAYDFNGSWSSVVGLGIDDPHNPDLTTGMRSQNRTIFANVTYKIQKAVELTLEAEHLRTSYLNAKAGENLRLQFASYFKF